MTAARFSAVIGVVSLMTVHGAAQAQARPGSKASSRTEAWLFSYATTVTANGRAATGPGLAFDVAVWRGVARVTVRGGAFAAVTGARGALLVRAGDTLIVAINPDKREVLVLPSGQLGDLIGGPVPGGLQLDISDVSSTIRRGGAGPRVEGHASQHLMIQQAYTMTIGINAMRRTIRNRQQVELDVSPSLSRLDRGFAAFAEQVVAGIGTPAAVRAMLRPLQRSLPPGFPVRSVTTAVIISGSDTVNTKSESAITGLRREVVDTTLFQAPPDFRVTELRRLLQPRRPT